MAVCPLKTADDPYLRQEARTVAKVSRAIQQLLDDMRDTMYDSEGVGLAAPQIGVGKRVIVVDIGEGLVELVNPVIKKRQGAETDIEGCLSVPGWVGEVNRYHQIKVQGWNRKGRMFTLEAQGFLARVIQHEIDHLDGLLFTDRALFLEKLPEDEQQDPELQATRSALEPCEGSD